MAKPLISIVTVCYNSFNTIEKTIRSVIHQTYPNIEYIIIDGGSTDGTVDIIKRYSQYITFWISEPDNGIYDAMNKGIKKASGEWIHFRNSGDFFVSKNTIEDFFENPVTDDVMILHGKCFYVYPDGYLEKEPPILSTSYKKQIPVLHPATFVRTDLQKQMPFDVKYKSSADYDFFYKCSEMGIKFEYRPIVVAAFEVGGFSSNWKRAYFEDCKLQGKSNNLIGVVGVYANMVYLSLKRFFINFIRTAPVIRTIAKYRRKYLNHEVAKMPLPVPVDF